MRTCEHMTLGQLRMGARQAEDAPLLCSMYYPVDSSHFAATTLVEPPTVDAFLENNEK